MKIRNFIPMLGIAVFSLLAISCNENEISVEEFQETQDSKSEFEISSRTTELSTSRTFPFNDNPFLDGGRAIVTLAVQNDSIILEENVTILRRIGNRTRRGRFSVWNVIVNGSIEARASFVPEESFSDGTNFTNRFIISDIRDRNGNPVTSITSVEANLAISYLLRPIQNTGGQRFIIIPRTRFSLSL